MMDVSLLEPRIVLKVEAEKYGGWTIDLSCGHAIWSAVALQEPVSCGICAQRLIRQIHELCAKQAPPPYSHG